MNSKVDLFIFLNKHYFPSTLQIHSRKYRLSRSSRPCAERGINGKVTQRLGKEVRGERERRIPPVGVTGEVIHDGSLLLRGESNRRGGGTGGSEKAKKC